MTTEMCKNINNINNKKISSYFSLEKLKSPSIKIPSFSRIFNLSKDIKKKSKSPNFLKQEKEFKPFKPSKECIYKYVVTQLDIIENTKEEIINNEKWICKGGFTWALHSHDIFYNRNTNEYAFHISYINDYATQFKNFPNFGRYTTFEIMIEEVIDLYISLW